MHGRNLKLFPSAVVHFIKTRYSALNIKEGGTMKKFLAMLAVVNLSMTALAGERPMMVSFKDLKWTELPERPGMQFAVLSGDPKTGEYTQIRKVPAGTDNPLHSHSSELKNVIISGVWYTGTDAASAKDFGPGSVVMMPANWVHVSGCRAGSDCVFYQEGKGKFDFKPVAAEASGAKPGQ
jgi:quercetin dioxygenase-like cupin family protein